MTPRRDRLPPIPADRLTDDQQAAVEELVASRRGAVIGPFIPALRSPELTRRLQRLGEYVRYDSALPQKLREMAILLTAHEWSQEFEWHIHAPIAAASGLEDGVIAAIAAGVRPASMSPDEALIHDLATELHRTHQVGDATYDAAVAEFGEQGIVDLIAVIGYYTMLAMIMNVAQTPVTEGLRPKA